MRRYLEVDVFASGPLTGNPLAVVVDAAGLDDAQMQAFARWTNLSETTFLLPPTDPAADYRVRIFTPFEEYPFAGHPTLGSARAWLASGGAPATPGRVVQECGAGLVPVRLVGDTLAFAAPPRTRSGPLDAATLDRLLAALGLGPADIVAHAWGVNGPAWPMLQLGSPATLRAVDAGAGLAVGLVGLCALTPDGPHAYEVRGLFAGGEDPVTGSLNAALAQWLRERGLVPKRYTVSQGTAIGRAGVVSVHDDGTDTWIGGAASVVVAGAVELDGDALGGAE